MSNKETILIVDDEVASREALRMILQPRYKVHTASDGQEALSIITSKDIDLVTLDLNMPGLSGIDVLKAIRKLRPNTEVIVITGYGTIKNAQEAFDLGVGNFISKPFNVAEILCIIANSLARRAYNLKVKSLIGHVQGLHFSFNGGHKRDDMFWGNVQEVELGPTGPKDFMDN